ncbi:Spy/CpxP family protein refolding chaperone [Falsiroseomonas sp. CW058]|uniref:Spy/CpxP family protein refolding chaperone n=1 Tax=Falsiroseomonas sp. CW058 TaxID=3388664 RepID=UPI003D317A9F
MPPYAGLEGRRIKALSEEDAAGLLAGRGMALALAAELNGYPGPMHVLEHADALGLSAAQRATAESLRSRMLDEARAIGARIVALEEELDRLFAGGMADTGRLAVLTASLGALNGRLREVHLASHIAMRDALRPEQRLAYDRLRGYASRR